MKHNKLIASLAVAGGVFAMTGAAHASAPAAAAALGIVGGAVAGSAVAQANVDPPAVAVVPASPTVVMGAAPAPAGTYSWTPGHYVTASNGASIWVEGQWTPTVSVSNYDHDGDGVLNHSDRFPNDAGHS